jgi:predicted RNA-binding protein YlxR (DUF448 family)/ribosomal protein L30E
VVCRAKAAPKSLLRVVHTGDGHVVPDLSGTAFGRGAWLHPRPECLAKAQRALQKNLKTRIVTTRDELVEMLRAQAERRFVALLNSASRQRALAVGKTRVEKLLEDEKAHLIIAARDARAALDSAVIQRAIQSGLALAWGDKCALGVLVGREEAAVLAVLDDGLANALKTTIAMAHLGDQGSLRTVRNNRVTLTEVG